ncbi:MAG: ABC transporter ATP-binding protein [Armatimonadota bacterium]
MHRRLWSRVTLCVVLLLLQSVILMPVFFFYRRMIDISIPHKDIRGILVIGAMAIGLYAANFGVGVLARYLTLKTTKIVIYELRARVCTKLQELCMSYYDNSNVGNLHARAMIDTEGVDAASNALLTGILVSVTSFIVALVVLFRMNMTLTLVLLAMLPLIYFSRHALKNYMRESHREFRDYREYLSASIHNLLNSIRLVKMLGMEPFETEKLNANTHDYLRSSIKACTISFLFGSMIMTIAGLGTMSVWVIGAMLVVKGHLTVGDVVAFAGLQVYLVGPINQMAGFTEMLYSGSTALKSVFGLLDEAEVEFPLQGIPIEKLHGRVDFEGVSFEYSDGTKALDGISFTAAPGRQIALVGESGAGKSTLIHLILGLYLPTDGRVLVDGQDITSLDLRSLRRQIGMVSQETILMNGTVKDNISYGTPDADFGAIKRAAEQANADGFISKLADGYDSLCGENGVRLSGGQRQRIAIARALLRDPSILILDEATSSLDSESEAQIQEAMEVLRKNRTTFVIAHRLSTILTSDTILVMRDGRIVESGMHEELLANGGVYAGLYHTQFRR